MALSNILRAAAILAAAALVATDRITLALLIIVVLINAGARATYYSSLQAMVPELVRNDALERANGVLTGTEAGTEYLAGPVVGTSLFAVSQSAPFFADAIALISSCIPFVKLPSKASATPETSNSIWEGVRLLFADRRLRVLVLMVAALALFQGMEGGVLVLLATTEWGVREGAYGLFLASTAVGNLLGSALADGQVRRFGSARALIGAAVLSGVGYLIMASAHSWVVAAPAFALVGVAVSIITVVAISLRQRLTPPHLMGRVGSAWRGLVWGAAPVGALVAGSVATIGGLRLPLLLAGALQCAVAIVFARPLLRSTRVDTPTTWRPRGGDGSSCRRSRDRARSDSVPRRPCVTATAIAHRGDPVHERENTLPAFTAAVAQGADMVELDLRRTRDDEIVVLHDQTLRRLWGVDASVGDLDLAEVASIGDGDVRIPALREVLAVVRAPLMVDFTRREVVPGAVDAVREAGALERSLFVTGNVEALRMLRGLSTEARIGLTWLDGSAPPLPLLEELGAEFWNPMFGLVTPEGVAEVHGAGLKVSTWTVDEPDDMARVVEAGVDAVVSNRVEELVRFLRR